MLTAYARLVIGGIDSLLVELGEILQAILSVFIHLTHIGGPLMWPIWLCTFLALAIVIRDGRRLSKLHTTLSTRRQLMALLEQGRPDLALRLCMANPGGSIERLVHAAVRHGAQPRHRIAQAVDEVVVELHGRLASMGRPLPAIAKVVVLTGLLGTIQGIIMSFEAVARASCENKNAMIMGGAPRLLPGPRQAPWMQLPPQAQPIAADEHAHPGISGMVPTSASTRSTFGLDVDTASYSIVRKRLERGWLPVPEAVRVEEFINALPYSYAATHPEAPLTAHMELAPDPWNPGRHLLAVGLKGRVPEGPRPALNLVFLVDTSGSMSSRDRLPLARDTLHELLENLEPYDSVALLTFADGSQTVLTPTYAYEKERIHQAIDRLESSGSTAMADGLQLAYRTAARGHRQGCESRVILLSDGGANVGAADHEAILAELGELRASTTLTTVGFGMGSYRDHLMEQLADRGDGNAFYIDNLGQARRVFGSELNSTLLTIARDVKLQVAFDPELVEAWRLLGYENRVLSAEQFRDDAVDAGELGAGHAVTALYQLVLYPERSGGAVAELHLRARPSYGDAPAQEWITSLPITAARPSFEAASSDLHAAWSAATFAELLRDSPFVHDQSYTELWREARRHQRPFPEDEELLQMVAQAARIDEGGPVAWACMRWTDGWEGCL